MIKLQEAFVAATSFIRESKRLHEGVLNAIEELDRLMQTVSESDAEDITLRKI